MKIAELCATPEDCVHRGVLLVGVVDGPCDGELRFGSPRLCSRRRRNRQLGLRMPPEVPSAGSARTCDHHHLGCFTRSVEVVEPKPDGVCRNMVLQVRKGVGQRSVDVEASADAEGQRTKEGCFEVVHGSQYIAESANNCH